jgi:hypothetical protein
VIRLRLSPESAVPFVAAGAPFVGPFAPFIPSPLGRREQR